MIKFVIRSDVYEELVEKGYGRKDYSKLTTIVKPDINGVVRKYHIDPNKFKKDDENNGKSDVSSFNLSQKLSKKDKELFSSQIHNSIKHLYKNGSLSEVEELIKFHNSVLKKENTNNYSKALLRVLNKIKLVKQDSKFNRVKSCEVENEMVVKKFLQEIEKNKKDLSESAKNSIEADIKNGCWVAEKTTKGNEFYIDITKYYDRDTEAIEWEKIQAGVYADLGMKVFLPKESTNSIDSIINELRFELKYIHGKSNNTLQNAVKHAIKQSDNSCYFIAEESSQTIANTFKVIDGKQNISSHNLKLACVYSQKEKKLKFKDYSIKKSGLLKNSPVGGRITFFPSNIIIPQIQKMSI